MLWREREPQASEYKAPSTARVWGFCGVVWRVIHVDELDKKKGMSQVGCPTGINRPLSMRNILQTPSLLSLLWLPRLALRANDVRRP